MWLGGCGDERWWHLWCCVSLGVPSLLKAGPEIEVSARPAAGIQGLGGRLAGSWERHGPGWHGGRPSLDRPWWVREFAVGKYPKSPSAACVAHAFSARPMRKVAG